jgi:hypothetical protein
VRIFAAVLAFIFAASPTTASATEALSLDPLFRLILALQSGDAEEAQQLVSSHPDARPVLVRAQDGRLGHLLGGSMTTFANFLSFRAGACRLIKLEPQSDVPNNPNAYDVFFDCNGEGKAMQVTIASGLIMVTDFANIVIPPALSPPARM